MSDYLGLNQTRVLDSSNRSFEAVVYQRKKPPLSCEVNFMGNLESAHLRDVAELVGPSGWVSVGNIKDNVSEISARCGDVITSPTYGANTFKLMATDKGLVTGELVAWVNGMKVVVQGTNSPDENNVITLPAPPSLSNRVDFVFLEVWRKLVTPSDVIYTHGNVLYGSANYLNDLIDPAASVETTLRIQVQYRIRVASVDIDSYPEGFDPNQVYAQGPLANPLTCTGAAFVQMPDDPGLWRAGLGDSAAQQSLQTVDGYTYGIPMFAICRRNTSQFNPNTHTNGAGYDLTHYLNGWTSDRPDNLFSDWVVTDDIMDMRHTIKADNLRDKCNEAFQKLISGKLRGKMQKNTLGEDRFENVAVQIDGISSADPGWFNRITVGDGIRRTFSNAALTQEHALIEVPASGTWNSLSTIGLAAVFNYPIGTTIYNVASVWAQVDPVTLIPLTLGVDYNVTYNGSTAVIDFNLGSSFIFGTSYTLTVDYTIQYPAVTNISGYPKDSGLYYLPYKFLESRMGSDSTVAFPLSVGSSVNLHGISPVISSDGTFSSSVFNKGANSTEPYDFGIQMTYSLLGSPSNTIVIPRNIWGYEILGVVSIYIPSTLSYRPIVTVARNATSYNIVYSGTVATSNQTIQLVLYVGASNLNPSVPSKFFQTNKQGKAIVDTFQMKELVPTQAATGQTTFYVDAHTSVIQGIASIRNQSGYGIAYIDGTMTTTLTNNAFLPTDNTCSRATITFSVPPPNGSLIEVPALMKSPLEVTDNYQFYYQTIPYQGLLDTTTSGIIEAEGPTTITTAGSGHITDYQLSQVTATFSGILTDNSSTVTGSGTDWLSTVKPGYLINPSAHPGQFYTITEILDSTTLIINGSAGTFLDYYSTIIALDRPSFNTANVIDRLPTLDVDRDSSGFSESISNNPSISDEHFPVLNTHIMGRVQDIIDVPPNGVEIGPRIAGRGRSTVHITDSDDLLGLGNLGLNLGTVYSVSYSLNYQKGYQAYILNKEDTGKLYLMVVGSETNNSGYTPVSRLSPFSNNDTVDIFQIPGRPLMNGKSV